MEYIVGNLETENRPSELAIWDKIQETIDPLNGIIGYKFPSLDTLNKDDIPTFVIRGKDTGIILIDVLDEKLIDIDEEFWFTENGEQFSRDLSLNLYEQEILSRLKKNNKLYNIRSNSWNKEIKIRKAIILPFNNKTDLENIASEISNPFYTIENLDNGLKQLLLNNDSSLDDSTADIIDSLLEGSDIFNVSRRSRRQVEFSTLNDFIQSSLDYTFKLDQIQRQVAMQVPPGPQRIRGLAGTGKTVILCMKAAIAHKDFPELKILFVFNTQSMYRQVKDLISKYYLHEAKGYPNWDNLHILHAWGGSSKEGVYFNTANDCGIRPKTFLEVKNEESPLDAIYSDLLRQAKQKIAPKYDIVLIDEAQDFTPAFFETIFFLTKPVDPSNSSSKRIIWAYDEFQSLRELRIKQPSDLFGIRETGEPNMPDSVLEGKYLGKINKDFVLPNSYRNPRITLMVAHSFAMGLYSQYNKIPIEDKSSWEARGYKVLEPSKNVFNEGDRVHVEREEENSKNILENILKQNGRSERELITFTNCTDINNQLSGVINKIDELVNKQNVKPEEIIVIDLDTKDSKFHFETIRQELDYLNIKCITPGYIEKSNLFKEPGYVTLSTAFRAKGNEANIVIILNAQYTTIGTTFTGRNAFFVSTTRSRGWTYIYGQGPFMKLFEEEWNKMQKDYPYFDFIFPSNEAMKRRLTIINSSSDLEKTEEDINKLLLDDSKKALLIEKLSQDPEFINKLLKNNSSNDKR
ncbi:hypothetical protein EFA69_13445 [Rufibacter immobilis]|uniref:DNA 3'-5' helicase II n=1 Tax=Rufibacter immobilis TaxID=1348778 RepID=A0A3M9MPN2_9BACT|nr:DEAD/DEAH box helicase [Rufibacter immobilis]RNI27167.1 hypothetical protein EFA69_13445 [Rufibacter immobilis]